MANDGEWFRTRDLFCQNYSDVAMRLFDSRSPKLCWWYFCFGEESTLLPFLNFPHVHSSVLAGSPCFPWHNPLVEANQFPVWITPFTASQRIMDSLPNPSILQKKNIIFLWFHPINLHIQNLKGNHGPKFLFRWFHPPHLHCLWP